MGEMKRTNSKLILLPRILKSREENVKGYDYATKTTIPTLDDYIIKIFKSAFLAEAWTKGSLEVGLDSGLNLKEKFTYKGEEFDGKQMIANLSTKDSTPSYKEIIESFQTSLESKISDNRKRVSIVPLIDDVEDLREHVIERKPSEKTEIIDLKTGKKAEYKNIKKLLVYLDFSRFKHITINNYKDYFDALSLKNGIEAFKDEFKELTMGSHGIPEKKLKKSVGFDYELRDGSGVSYLFSPNSGINYSNVYKELFQEKTGKKEEIKFDTGDLVIIRDLVFQEDYNYGVGNKSIHVSSTSTTMENNKSKTGIMSILRKDGKTEKERHYNIEHINDTTYVEVKQILDTLSSIMVSNEEHRKTKMKIDFFSAPSKYLQKRLQKLSS